MITKELKKITNKVSGDITEITKAYNTTQENTGKPMENAISQMLTKAQIIAPSTSIDPRNCGTNYVNPSHETSELLAWLTFGHCYVCW